MLVVAASGGRCAVCQCVNTVKKVRGYEGGCLDERDGQL